MRAIRGQERERILHECRALAELVEVQVIVFNLISVNLLEARRDKL